MPDIYADKLYNPDFQITPPPSSTPVPTVTISRQDDIFSQRLQTANIKHLSAPSTPPRPPSPFREGSPYAPSRNNEAQWLNLPFDPATHMQKQQNTGWALKQDPSEPDEIARQDKFMAPPGFGPQPSSVYKTSESKKPSIYTCTYHGCTLRFETPAKLQQHKREHGSSTVTTEGSDRSGMALAAQQKSQAGPYKARAFRQSFIKNLN
jgi:hypothetical protein